MKKIIFMGTPDFAVPVLDAIVAADYEVVLVVTQPDRPVGRKRVLTAPPVKKAAIKHDIPVFQPEKLRDEVETLREYEADLIVTAAYGQLLPKEVLDYPAFGCINVHASLLPKLRGGAPIHYAILQGEEETGITIMYMAEKLDAGDIISQASIPILEDDHVGTLHDKLSDLGANLLMDTLPEIFEGTNKRVVQNEDEASFASNITRAQEKIDFTNSSETVYNHIRGLHPWPVAYAKLEGQNIKIWWAEKDVNMYENSQPGEIVAVTEEAFIVACGDKGAVKIKDVQVAGKRRMTVSQLLKGNSDQFQVGQLLE